MTLKTWIRTQPDQELIAYTIQWLKTESRQAQSKIA